MTEIKIAYLTVARSFPGLLKQVSYDRTCTSELEGAKWEHFTYLDTITDCEHGLRLPALCTGVFGRKLFAWIWLLRNAKRYDYVVIRHMEFDPFALIFAKRVPNRVLVHHSKEVLELRLIRKGWKGRAASLLEVISGRVATNTAAALVGVTREIGLFQKESRKLPDTFPVGTFPNGVLLNTVPVLSDLRKTAIIELAFICGSFASWHGLDRLLESLWGHSSEAPSTPIRLHLIGRLSKKQIAQVSELNAALTMHEVIMYGRLGQNDYLKVLERCHVGIGSLAMDRIGLREGATLKVREMLAMGLPIYSGHADTALPNEFPFYMNGPVDFALIAEFACSMSTVPRMTVRDAARPYIDKRLRVEEFNRFIRKLKWPG